MLMETLGATPEEMFERFDPTPVAAASIGQVHRGRFAHRDVAIKVLPGRARNDGQRHRPARDPPEAGLVGDRHGRAPLVAELPHLFFLKCDYEQEARSQAAFHRAFARFPDMYIPEVFFERTPESVLTTEWCNGRDFYALIERDGSVVLLDFGCAPLAKSRAFDFDLRYQMVRHPYLPYLTPAFASPWLRTGCGDPRRAQIGLADRLRAGAMVDAGLEEH